MPRLNFQVEFLDPGGKFLVARQLEEGTFKLGVTSTFNGVPVKAMANQPGVESDGSPRIDLFIVALKNAGDSKRFKVGEIVPLVAEDAPKIKLF